MQVRPFVVEEEEFEGLAVILTLLLLTSHAALKIDPSPQTMRQPLEL